MGGDFADVIAGAGGSGEVLNYGKITTSGCDAHGIVLQSIAGGRGAAGSAGGLVGIGGNSTYNYTANGGAVDLDNQGQITTTGEAAVGIVVQSIGGGNGGDATGYSGESLFNLQVGGSADAASSGGAINVYLNSLTVHTDQPAASAWSPSRSAATRTARSSAPPDRAAARAPTAATSPSPRPAASAPPARTRSASLRKATGPRPAGP